MELKESYYGRFYAASEQCGSEVDVMEERKISKCKNLRNRAKL